MPNISHISRRVRLPGPGAASATAATPLTGARAPVIACRHAPPTATGA